MIVKDKSDIVTDPKKSPLAPGNETMTNLSILSLVEKDGMLQRMQDNEDEFVKNWSIRVFESKNPIVTLDAGNEYADGTCPSEPSYGHHYVVVASPKASDNFSNITVDQWSNVLVVIQDRLRWLYTQKGVTYVLIYANQGTDAGSIYPHPYLNMMTLSTIPPVIEREIVASARILNEKGFCPMCKIIESESSSPRQVLQTEGFISICPWESAHPYELWVCPKRHETNFAKISQKEINDLALMMRSTLGGLSKTIKNPAYNIVFHLSPEKKHSKQIHWHIEIYPVLAPASGLERGYGIYINDVSPEDAAKKLGATSRKELAVLVGIE
ncbi:MAG: galactose-1-phosphate uridylyltransferase [Cenarchaeum symbiont of Oopsacas minuta]|nr:galactose-1-phosphate uridylyltransferase [Cenarchaeum symbiont of Oopsacas minuta]